MYVCMYTRESLGSSHFVSNRLAEVLLVPTYDYHYDTYRLSVPYVFIACCIPAPASIEANLDDAYREVITLIAVTTRITIKELAVKKQEFAS